MPKQPVDDATLAAYLVGNASETETERLDELSLTDDDFAERLRAAENDLVDGYVRGELSPEARDRFIAYYLSSHRRREKVRAAEALLVYVDTAPETVLTDHAPGKEAGRKPFGFKFFAVPLQWGFAAAALVLLLGGGYLVFENARLRNQITETRTERASLEHRERELQRQLAEQRSSNEETASELARVRDRLAELEQQQPSESQKPKMVALNLSPQTRGVGQIPNLRMPVGTDLVSVTLELEPNEFRAYQAILTNPATGQIVWRSGKLKIGGKPNVLRFTLSGSLLKSQNYVLELLGISAGGARENLSSYPFKVVVR
ncbi:MAG TPA: hypothetical protein VLG74_04825 [Blastocatellia bacterium]|nr:hypothetical protein [Blastocatellia bacterium]